ncbi:hypothetical protein QBC33DRAFT_528812 [Phialemonium atrogriseum]|uniref:Uncharacterized protein n=1 Tax=Phialemonium atrogriseum TaxID=1093897 RepID=A0AAJ0FPY3_9PEZI|nr:uncharacterized protein QBC33DRAFT_528812 [Phialemonium atrogriseum]KAK1770654.1 hypothetical protein QBC33DRAFT_528812 [Phialemonium atrogriseum]
MSWLTLTPLQTTWAVLTTPALFLLRLTLIPVSALVRLLLFILSPVIYIVQYSLAPFYFVLRFLQALQPLYIFFGCAIVVGLLAGTVLQFTSRILVSVLGWDDDSGTIAKPASKVRVGVWKGKEEEDEEESSPSDWAWPEMKPKLKTRRRKTPGLTGQTILEEDDDS